MDTPRTILLTGANAGIGLQTARVLARQGHRLILHARNRDKANAAREALASETGNELLEVAWGDLGDLAQVRALAEQVRALAPRLDVLLNNAGIYARERRLSADGHELTLAVNHLAPFLLTHLLLDAIPASGRIVNVASIAHNRGAIRFDDLHGEREYNHYGAYAASKLANVLFTVELARRLGDAPTVNTLHPGVVSTQLLTEGFQMEGPDSLEEGARTSVFLATAPEVEGVTGAYFVRCEATAPHPVVSRPGLAARLYDLSAAMVGIEGLPARG